MDTVTVYRMENKDGIGPFISMDPEQFAKHVSWAHLDPNSPYPAISTDAEHPHHARDVKGVDLNEEALSRIMLMLGQLNQWRVGVKDKEQFLHWFPKDSLDYFDSLGFRMDEYEVPADKVKHGTWQVMFDSTAARLIAKESLKKLEKE